MEDKTPTNRKRKSHIPFRLNLLFFIVFVLFSALIFRLGYLQIVQGDEYETIVRRTETTVVTESVPRGLIYDNDGEVLVGNDAEHTITYTRGTSTSAEEMAGLATDLAGYIAMDTASLSERDLKDFWAAANEEALLERLTEEEKQLPGSELYEVELEKITADDIQYDEEGKQAAAIFKRMNSAYANSTVNIKNSDVTDEEVALVSENLATLPNIDVSSDWNRVYPQGSLLSSILGDVTSEQQGLPSDDADALLAKGYARNDRVGTSYLEEEYESVLSGAKAQYEIITNQSGDVVSTEEIYEGQQGDNLVLTIDTDFQQKLEEIAENYLQTKQDSWNDRVYIVALDPNNGDILGMTGKVLGDDGKITDDALGTVQNNFIMGSSIKPATVLSGYMDGVITLDDNTMIDEPLKFRGTEVKSSLFNRTLYNQVELTDITALQKSSNVYMMKIIMRMGGQYNYSYDTPLTMDLDAINTMREYFALFGLGVKTGIDLPSESYGYSGAVSETDAGKVLDFSFGQFDTYTPMQLAQYVSTVANGGTRYAPRLVSEIRGADENGAIGPVKTEIEPTVMNTINVTDEMMERVHQGMWQVTHNPTAASTVYFGDDPNDVAGKTGTAESTYAGHDTSLSGKSTINSTFVAFAPFDDPQIAVAVVVPYISNENYTPANSIAKKVTDAFFSAGTSSAESAGDDDAGGADEQ